MRQTGVCFLAFSVLWLVSALAHAQETDQCTGSNEEQARPLYEAGRVAYEAGRYEQALRYFQDAYDLCRRPAFLFNIASSADRLSENRRALESYRAYLAALPDAPNAEMVRNRIAFLERQLGGGRRTEERTDERDTTVATNRNARTTTPSGGGDITGEWWFWTLIGVGAVGVILAIVLPIALLSGGVQGPLPGTVNGTFTALAEF